MLPQSTVPRLADLPEIKYLLHDSRQLVSPKETLFFAIRGLHHNGHQYIENLYNRGVRAFVIEDASFPTYNYSEAKFWLTSSAIATMQAISREHRERFSLPVVGITGSNGKTIVKEWLAQLLAPEYKICRSPKSYNSQIGVPLSVWNLTETHTLGIFEAGISRPGEMPHLEEVIQPTIGILTNIGTAHDEAFGSRKEKIREKLALFKNVSTLIYCADYEDITIELPNFISKNCTIIGWKKRENPNRFQDDSANENAQHAIELLKFLGYTVPEIEERIIKLRPVSMRLELKEGIHNSYLIDDSYNNDLGGFKIALDFLANQNQRPNRAVILSDVLQSGLGEVELYQKVAQLLSQKEVQKIICIGASLSRQMTHFQEFDATFYENTSAFLAEYPVIQLRDSVVLVKGARTFQFEKIVQKLTPKNHAAVLEVNLDNLSHNLNYFREKVGQQTLVMVMVKAFAYGSGIEEVATLLQFHQVAYLTVAYPDEGVRLRQAGIHLPIMVLNVTQAAFEAMTAYNLEPEIYSPRILKLWLEYGGDSPVHIKLDTGMHRLGFDETQIELLMEVLEANPQVRIASIFSHLAAADDPAHDDFTKEQIRRFEAMSSQITQFRSYPILRHLANSPGIARFPEARFDMVRLGKGLYGTAVLPEDQANLKTVGTLKTVISQIKNVPAIETVGYGRKGVLTRDTKIATIAIGYADGYDRKFSRGAGKILINNVLCPVVGNVCMDMTMVDVTDINCQEGDEALIFGDYPTIRDLAEWSGTIPYEVLTNVGERVQRVYFREGN